MVTRKEQEEDARLDAYIDQRVDAYIDERMAKLNTEDSSKDSTSQNVPMPPSMQKNQDFTPEDILADLNRIPLFMTTLDETDGAGGENIALEGLRALAYEGTRAEVAQNFREQGTEVVREGRGRWREAGEYYSKALEALKRPRESFERGPDGEVEGGELGLARGRVVEVDDEGQALSGEVDEEEETRKERAIEEVCYVNRALCHLEMKNYGSCNRDCAAALRLNPANIKAWYRAASACLALDKIPEALDACNSGLKHEPNNSALKTLLSRISARQNHLTELERIRTERLERQKSEKATLRLALKTRKIPTRSTDRPPEMPEASISLEDPLELTSTLTFPVILLYPVHAQTDFIKAFREDDNLNIHLEYILPLPWDEAGEYTMEGTECYMETIEGGLIKAGKKLSLLKLLSSGKVEVVDGLVRVSVVPKEKAKGWIEDFKTRRGKF